jgi:hypothetical protein
MFVELGSTDVAAASRETSALAIKPRSAIGAPSPLSVAGLK